MGINNRLLLSQIKDNQVCTVTSLKTQGLLRQKLFNMGFVPGVEVEMIRSAPLFDPLEVQLLGYLVTLRCEEARMIEVELL